MPFVGLVRMFAESATGLNCSCPSSAMKEASLASSSSQSFSCDFAFTRAGDSEAGADDELALAVRVRHVRRRFGNALN